MDKENDKSVVRHQVIRLDIPIHEKYDDFLVRFESAVPMFNRARAVELIKRKAAWSEIVSDVYASAPHGFLLYWKLDLLPTMNLAGYKCRATEFLMGNHVIAETMYRDDPAVGLYVPLRCIIYEGVAGLASQSDSQVQPLQVSVGTRLHRSGRTSITSS